MSVIIDDMVWSLIFCKIRRDEVQALYQSRFFSSTLFFVAMSLSAGARLKCKSKKVLDPECQYEFPSSAFLQDDPNLEEQCNPVTFNQSTKHFNSVI